MDKAIVVISLGREVQAFVQIDIMALVLLGKGTGLVIIVVSVILIPISPPYKFVLLLAPLVFFLLKRVLEIVQLIGREESVDFVISYILFRVEQEGGVDGALRLGGADRVMKNTVIVEIFGTVGRAKIVAVDYSLISPGEDAGAEFVFTVTIFGLIVRNPVERPVGKRQDSAIVANVRTNVEKRGEGVVPIGEVIIVDEFGKSALIPGSVCADGVENGLVYNEVQTVGFVVEIVDVITGVGVCVLVQDELLADFDNGVAQFRWLVVEVVEALGEGIDSRLDATYGDSDGVCVEAGDLECRE